MRKSISLTPEEINFIFDVADRTAGDRSYSAEQRKVAGQLAGDIEAWNRQPNY